MGNIDVKTFVARFSDNGNTIVNLVSGLTPEQSRWKPAPSRWSILEVLNHLYDEEREDFRKRIELLLKNPEEPWPSVDPEQWCIERRYNDRDLTESIERFREERRLSVAWLRELDAPNWMASHTHPELGVLRAGDLLLSWLVHDYGHMRQIVRLHYAYTTENAKPFRPDYSGVGSW